MRSITGHLEWNYNCTWIEMHVIKEIEFTLKYLNLCRKFMLISKTGLTKTFLGSLWEFSGAISQAKRTLQI